MTDHRRTLRRIDGKCDARFLTFSCFQRLPLLTRDRTRQWTVEAIERARDKHGFELWAFVLMPEHVHLLIFPQPIQPKVGSILSTIKLSVSMRAVRWAKKHPPAFLDRLVDRAPDGSVTHRFWQRGGGYDRNLWSPKHIRETIDYIHRNPAERGLCKRPEDWTWSSIRAFRDPEAGPLRIDRQHIPAVGESRRHR